jgi:hypothetical protein
MSAKDSGLAASAREHVPLCLTFAAINQMA